MKLKRISIVLIFCFVIMQFGRSQHLFRCTVLDSLDHTPLVGVSVQLTGTANGAITDGEGNALLTKIWSGTHEITFSSVGHKKKSTAYEFPSDDSAEVRIIYLSQNDVEMEEVIVSSTRTNARIEDLPQKIEVLGMEEMNEESSLVPGSVASILGDIAIITIQRTNPVNGNDAVRMEGLDPQYTQLMRDGLPLYGGFSGSIGVLSIPPLDLKQVEIIKGSVSTLYGGGAIAGLINFISKTPTESPQISLLLNTKTLHETNIDAFISGKNENTGYTVFSAATVKRSADINGDGFTEVPENSNYTFHPRLFFSFEDASELILGLSSTMDHRKSGDHTVLTSSANALHTFLQEEKTFRTSVDLQFNKKLSPAQTFSIKSAAGIFQREMSYTGFHFNGAQTSSYSEASDLITVENNTIVAGINVVTESFRKKGPDPIPIPNVDNVTAGVFLQDDWQLFHDLMMETGVRFDHTNTNGNFLLPRIAFFYKPGNLWTIRLASGTGYKLPNILALTDPSPMLQQNSSLLPAERSYGINADINHHTLIMDNIDVEINQAFYYTSITDPLIVVTDSSNWSMLQTGTFSLKSYGSDTYLRMTYKEWELYLGYNHTEAIQHHPSGNIPMPFNPQDKFSATIAVSLDDSWRAGIESALTANQYISGNKRVPDFWFFAAMLERKFPFGSVVLNGENIFNVRQSNHEALVTGATTAPLFSPIWGPIEGRVINLSLKVNL